MTEEELRKLELERKEAISKLPPTKESINNKYLNKVGAACAWHNTDCYCKDCTFYRSEVYRLTGQQI